MAPNGKNGKKKARQKPVRTGKAPIEKDPGNGQFLAGNNGGGGRPKGSLDFMAVAREKAKETGENLRDILWDTFMAAVQQAKDGDIAAARAVWDRLCGGIERSPLVAVQVNSNGPPIPPVVDLEETARKLVELVEEKKADGC